MLTTRTNGIIRVLPPSKSLNEFIASFQLVGKVGTPSQDCTLVVSRSSGSCNHDFFQPLTTSPSHTSGSTHCCHVNNYDA